MQCYIVDFVFIINLTLYSQCVLFLIVRNIPVKFTKLAKDTNANMEYKTKTFYCFLFSALQKQPSRVQPSFIQKQPSCTKEFTMFILSTSNGESSAPIPVAVPPSLISAGLVLNRYPQYSLCTTSSSLL